MTKRFFNLVEITLAIAVIGIGVAGVMSLFPVAINSSRDAVGNNYSSQIADQFISYLTMNANKAATTWSSSGISGIPTAKPTADDSTMTDGDWTSVATGSNISTGSLGADTIYKVTQGNSSFIDFTAIVRVWQAPVNNVYIAGSTGALGQEFANRIYVEVSWPAGRVYNVREKRYYMIELFNCKLQLGL